MTDDQRNLSARGSRCTQEYRVRGEAMTHRCERSEGHLGRCGPETSEAGSTLSPSGGALSVEPTRLTASGDDQRNLSALPLPEDDEIPEFENEGMFTHWVCPDCGHNDWDEGDTRGDDITCPACGLKGRVASP